MAQTRTSNVDLDTWVQQAGGGNYGNGLGNRLQVGYAVFEAGSGAGRVLLRIPLGTVTNGVYTAGQLAGVTAAEQIIGYWLNLRVRGTQGCFSMGSGPRFWIEKLTAAFTENSGSTGECTQYASGSSTGRFPGPTHSTTDRVKYDGVPAIDSWLRIAITAMVRAAWAAKETELRVRLIAADASTGYDETTAARRISFYSRHTTSVPYGEASIETEVAPNAPSNMAPPANTVQGSTNGNTLTVSALHTHPEGKSSSHFQVEWYPTSATDQDPGTPLKTDTVTATTAHNATRSHTLTGLTPRTAGKWRIRFARVSGLWGPWSGLLQATPAYKPSATNPSVTPATLTPTGAISITSNDPAGEGATAIEWIVYQDTPSGVVTKYASGKVSIGGLPTRPQITYGGSALAYGVKYRHRFRVWNKDDVASDQTGDLYFTQYEALGPTVQIRVGTTNHPADQTVKIDTRTPTVRVSDPGGGNIDQAQVRLYSPTGVLLHDFGLQSFSSAAFRDFVVPANLWDWGSEPMVDARARVAGNADPGPFSDQKRIRINAAPGAPYPVALAVEGGVQHVQQLDGEWVTSSSRPRLVIPFRDIDRDLGYDEYPRLREVEWQSSAAAVLGRFVRVLHAIDDATDPLQIVSFDQPGSLTPAQSGFVAGASVALTYQDNVGGWATQGNASLKLAFTNLASGTTSISTLYDALRSGTLWTDLSNVSTFRIAVLRSQTLTGQTMALRFIFSGNAANFAQFTLTLGANGVWTTTAMTRTSPASTGGTVNWAQVSGIEIRVSHSVGSNQTFEMFVDDLRADALAVDTLYRLRARYDDTALVRSDYSDAFLLRRRAAPALSSVTPANAAAITDPTPTISWTISRTQARFRVEASVAGNPIYDSGVVSAMGTTGAHTIPRRTLPTGATVTWTLTVWDQYGLTATLTRTFTTNFATPPALTGLALTPDEDQKAIVVSWDQSGLTTAEFDRYAIYARSVFGQFRQIATISDKATTSFVFRGAPHMIDTIVRVTQDNGFAESAPIEGSALLEVDGYWRIGSDGIPVELRWARTGLSGGMPTQTAEYEPEGANYKRVVTLGTYGREWELPLWMPAEDEGVVRLLEEDKQLGRIVIVKTPRGRVIYSKLKSVVPSESEAGYTSLTLSGVEVGPEAAGF
ncbi:MAG TPA: hypothetical protein VM305_08385 [Candidatus Limnocylindrales bacterium]|nr:hypothetical protein [Candidatus Limnocylindrales bacterium]